MDEFDSRFVADLIGHIYQSAVEPAHWGEFVGVLERVYPESRVTLFGHDKGRPTANLAAHVNYAESDLRSYADYYIGCSPYVARAAAFPVGRAFHYDMAIRDAELQRTEYYNDYLRPRRLGHYGTGLIIERDGVPGTQPTRATVLSLADHKNDAGRRARQLRLLDLLGPHLQRAFGLHRVVTAERARAGAIEAAFDRWAHAALVFDEAARVVAYNGSAEALLARGDGLWLGRGGALCSADETATRALERAIRTCATLAAGGRDDFDGVLLPRPSGAPLRVMITPLSEARRDGRGAVLAVVVDPAQAQRTPVGWLAQQYRLSPAEARLTAAVVNGMPLDQAAEALGIRLTTARTRLKTILTKTHCHRQVDLVRLALSLPPLR